MIAGTQSPSAGLLQAVQNKLLNKPLFGTKELPVTEEGVIDSLEVSPEALASVAEGIEALKTIQDGQEELLQKSIDFAYQRLAQIREQMDFVSTLMAAAGGKTDKALSSHIREIGKGLKSLGQEIRMMVRGAQQAGNLASVQGKAGEAFNASASVLPADAIQASYKQTLSVEMTSIQFTQRTESLTVTEAEDGSLTAGYSFEETTLSVSMVNIAYEESLSLSLPGENPLGDLVAAWQGMVDEYLALAEDSDTRGNNFSDQLRTLAGKLSHALPEQPVPSGDVIDTNA